MRNECKQPLEQSRDVLKIFQRALIVKATVEEDWVPAFNGSDRRCIQRICVEKSGCLVFVTGRSHSGTPAQWFPQPNVGKPHKWEAAVVQPGRVAYIDVKFVVVELGTNLHNNIDIIAQGCCC